MVATSVAETPKKKTGRAGSGGGGEPGGGLPPDPPGDAVTTIKVRVRIARLLQEIATLRGVLNQDVLNAYESQFVDELGLLLAQRQEQLKKRGG